MKICAFLAAFGSIALGLGTARGEMVRVTVSNLSPANGLFLTPLWVGFHNGSFDLFNIGAAVGSGGLPAGLEPLAEDGVNAPLSANFAASSAGLAGGIDATFIGPNGLPGPIDPGETFSVNFGANLDPVANRYFSYATMIIPSNDAFIANDDPLAHPLFDSGGKFLGADILVLGANVLDAGTEVNTERDAAFLNEAAINDGVVENGVVRQHPGFNGSVRNPNGSPRLILGATTAGPNGNITIDSIAGDFTRAGYQVARITISAQPAAVPEPSAIVSLGVGVVGLLGLAARRLRS